MRYLSLSVFKKLIVFLLVNLFILPSICFSTSLSITNSSPYSNGAISIHKEYDTIKFSNGISLLFFNQTTMIPEPVKLDYSIAIDSNRYFVKAGFRYLQSVTWGKSSADSMLKIYNNHDTVWAASKTFPDSVTQMDSLFESPGMPYRAGMGKWLYYTDGDYSSFYRYWAGKIENFNNVIYIQASQNKMKLQVSIIYINLHTPGVSSYVDSLRILWAVDSLGNGKFTDLTNTKGVNKPSGNPKSPPLLRLKNGSGLRIIQNSGAHVSLFDIRGKQIPIISDNDRVIPSGVFVYKIDNNKISALGKVIVR